MTAARAVLERTYAAFNARDIDAVGTDNDGHVFILSNDFIF